MENTNWFGLDSHEFTGPKMSKSTKICLGLKQLVTQHVNSNIYRKTESEKLMPEALDYITN